MTSPSWDDFQIILSKNNIPQNQQSYYVKRIEKFLWFIFGSASKNHGSGGIDNISSIKAEDVSGFLQEIDRKTEMSSWQFRQLIHILKLLLISLCHLESKGSVNDFWLLNISTLKPILCPL